MYLINWNPEASRIEASFGGCITNGEAEVFLEELHEQLSQRQGRDFSMVLDFAMCKRLDAGVLETFHSAREACRVAGAKKVVFVARDEKEAVALTDSRLQQVLDGREEYVPYKLAA
jgi:hypothetical protein